jgi:hypothetical protein
MGLGIFGFAFAVVSSPPAAAQQITGVGFDPARRVTAARHL